ncbi:MAG: immunoglobulin domain-containing protein [Verrucomicrobiales bacterium]|nr:immunoglobulin domain-containing protein [Verrucomicrobiales bacterium]
MQASKHFSWLKVFSALSWLGLSLQAASIPGLFGTGVDNNGTLLGPGAVDPHYKLVTSADTSFPGPDSIVVSDDFPIAGQAGNGPWLTNGPLSRWIGPQADQTCCGQGTAGGNGGNAPGDYVYRITFDLTGFDLSTVKLTGQWACDSEGTDIKINGTSTGNKIPPFPPQPSEAWHPFTISSGFVDGVNTLDFLINRSSGKYPTGLRAEVSATGTQGGGGAVAPAFLVQPKSQAVKLGASATLLASVKGTSLNYQWRRGGQNIAGATGPRLEFASVKESDFGIYDLVVSNAAGTSTSDPASLLLAVPIPGLFNTGTDANRALLADGAVDPHYKLTASSDSTFPGPDTLVVTEGSPISPSGNWFANGPDSRWIAPSANQDVTSDGGNLAGLYTCRVTFDLSGLDPATASLTGQWAVNGAMPDVILNEKSTGLQIGPFQPERLLRPFTIASGFVSGVNTLDFVVSATGTAGSLSATGLRVELQGTVGELPPNTLASFLEQPQSQVVLEGDSATFRAAVRGSPPLTYQWRLNGANVPGATSPSLLVNNASASNSGNYDLVVTNPAGSATSAAATLTVLVRVPGLFNTGTGSDGKALEDGMVDPHYQLITNANDPQSKGAVVEDSTVFPIVAGPYVPNSDASKWIGPLLDPNGAPGDYVYRTTFELTGLDPATIVLTGRWAVDDTGADILLNGTSTGLQNGTSATGGFSTFTPFVLTAGFKAGVNTLDFLVHNGALADDPTAPNPTGLRVDGLRAGGKLPGATPSPALGITRSGAEFLISWPASATEFKLFTTTSLTAPQWTAATGAIVVSGDQNTYRAQGTDTSRFFRLQR